MPTCRSTCVELLAVERAVGPLEGRVFARELRQPVLGDAEPELARLLVEHRAGDQLRQHLLVDAERHRLLARQPRAELLRDHLHLPVVGEAIVLQRHRRAARLDDMRGAEAADHLPGNAPDREADDQHEEQKFGDPGTGGLAKCVEHVSFRLRASAFVFVARCLM